MDGLRMGAWNEVGSLERRSVERLLRLQREVTEISRRLMSAAPGHLDQEILEAIETAAALAGAERTHLRVLSDSGVPLGEYSWIVPGLEAHLPLRDPARQQQFRWITRKVLAREVICLPRTEAIPDEAEAERAEFRGRGVRSMLTIPLASGDHVIGYQVFECFREARDWIDEEISLLRLLGEIFAGAIGRRHAEQALRASEARFRAFTENTPELIAELDPQGNVLYVSPSAEEVTGYAEEAIRGENVFELIHEEDRAGVMDGYRHSFETDGPYRSAFRFRHGDESWRWFDSAGQAFRNASGEQRLVAIVRDVTERRELEEKLRESQAQLYQSQKMEAVGRLAGGIAHDFNNLLMVITGNSRALLREQGLSERGLESARDVHDASERAAALTRQLLSFSRRQLVAPRPVALDAVVADIEDMLRRLIGEDVELHVALAAGSVHVVGDAPQLEQVLVNLAVNARDAMPDGGRLFVETSRCEITADQARRLGTAAPGSFAVLSVRDTGEGMDEETLERAFEPFFTTKDPDRGTGLGLSIVYGVAQQSGGAVSVDSKPGSGAAFQVYFPVRDVSASSGAPVPVPVERPAAGTVLLVEDEQPVRRLVRRMLEDQGYQVLEAGDGHEALELAAGHSGVLDILITDIVMPRMSGPDLARALREHRPGLAVLFVSGYPRGIESERAPVEGAEFLQKPFAPESLIDLVRALGS